MTDYDLTRVLFAVVSMLWSFLIAGVYYVSRVLKGQQRDQDERMLKIEQAIHRLAPGVARQELSFLSDRVVKLERIAPLAVRCDPAEITDGDVRCPYCHDDLGGAVVRCARCDAQQHAECYENHGRCAVFGCGSRLTRAREEAPCGP